MRPYLFLPFKQLMKRSAIAMKPEPLLCLMRRPPSSRRNGSPMLSGSFRWSAQSNAYQPETGLWKTSAETSFYLSSHRIDANHAALAIRKHWGIENKLHYTRDVTLREDASRIRKNPGVFARLRSFAYNILRFNQSDTIAQDRYAAALGGLKFLCSLRFQ